MTGSELWNRNEILVTEPILVTAMDSGRVGPTDHRSRAAIEGSPTSPTGLSALPSTPVDINPRRVDRLGCSERRFAPHAVEPLDGTQPRSTNGSAAQNLPNPPTDTAGERHIGVYGRHCRTGRAPDLGGLLRRFGVVAETRWPTVMAMTTWLSNGMRTHPPDSKLPGLRLLGSWWAAGHHRPQPDHMSVSRGGRLGGYPSQQSGRSRGSSLA